MIRRKSNEAQDKRLEEGLLRQRELIARAEAAGAMQCGWKAGFGSPAAQKRFALNAPLVGALLNRTRLDPGTEISIGPWDNPRAEAEIAVLIGEGLDGNVTPDLAIQAVVGFAPAIELVDVYPVPESPSEALSGNLFQRHWATGDFAELPPGSGLSGLTAEVHATGSKIGPVGDVQELTGNAGETLSEIARIGARQGRGLLRGDVVILGSIIAPVPIISGGDFRFTLSGHRTIALNFTD